MEAHLERMINEREQLKERVGKLGNFIVTSKSFAGLSSVKQALLLQQHMCMGQYQSVLEMRIEIETRVLEMRIEIETL